MYLYRDGQGPVDLTLVPADTDAPLGLMVRKQLGFPSRRLWIGRQEGKVRAVFQPAENRWGFANRDPGETPGVTGKEYRMIWRDDRVGGFLSDGGTTYRQIIGEKLDLPETYVIGVTYGGGEKPARCVLKENAASSLPIVAHIGKPPDRRTGKLPLPQKPGDHPSRREGDRPLYAGRIGPDGRLARLRQADHADRSRLA